MHTFVRFFYEFISIFFDGVITIFKGIGTGFAKMFKFTNYQKVFNSYNTSFTTVEWILVGLTVLVLVAMVGLTFWLVFWAIKRYIKFGKGKYNQEELLNEIGDLNHQVKKLMKEKDEILAMKVSQLGLSPDDETTPTVGEDGEEIEEGDIDLANVRFTKLSRLDEEFKNYKVKNYGNNFTLRELTENFRAFSASQLKLYYDYSILRPFMAGLACGKYKVYQVLVKLL